MQTILDTLVLPYITLHLIAEPTVKTTESLADLPDHHVNYYNKDTGQDIKFYIAFTNKQPLTDNHDNVTAVMGEKLHEMISKYAKDVLGINVERQVTNIHGSKLRAFNNAQGLTKEDVERETFRAIGEWCGQILHSIYSMGGRHRYERISNFNMMGTPDNVNLNIVLGKSLSFYSSTDEEENCNLHYYTNPMAWGMTGEFYMFGKKSRFVVARSDSRFTLHHDTPIDLANWVSRDVMKKEIINAVKKNFAFMGEAVLPNVISDIRFDDEFKRPGNEHQLV